MIPFSREAARRGRFRRALEHVTLLELGALAIGVTSIALFGWLARAVMRDELAELNRTVLVAVHGVASPTLDTIALAVTSLGSVPFVTAVGIVLAVFLWRGGRRIDAWVLITVLTGGGILSWTLKAAFGMPRPDVFEPLYRAGGLSFPSGHSLISYCLWGFVATWLVATNPRSVLRWLGATGCIAIATAVALSRLYIGVHWPSDIAAGLLVAAFWLVVCFVGRQLVRTRVGRRDDLVPTAWSRPPAGHRNA